MANLLNLEKYLEVDAKTNCWIWKRSKNNYGYAGFWYQKKHRLVHRVLYELNVGVIPENMTLDHLCRNRSCVNFLHLEPVSIAENVRRGSLTKLNVDKVAEIKSLYKKGLTQTKISKLFGVGQDQISRIINGKRWLGV